VAYSIAYYNIAIVSYLMLRQTTFGYCLTLYSIDYHT